MTRPSQLCRRVVGVGLNLLLLVRVQYPAKAQRLTCAPLPLYLGVDLLSYPILSYPAVVLPCQTSRFASDVQPSALFVELEDAAAAAGAVARTAGGEGKRSSPGGDERTRSTAVGGFWLGLDTRYVEDAPGLAVIKTQPGSLEPSKRRPLNAQLQVPYAISRNGSCLRAGCHVGQSLLCITHLSAMCDVLYGLFLPCRTRVVATAGWPCRTRWIRQVPGLAAAVTHVRDLSSHL